MPDLFVAPKNQQSKNVKAVKSSEIVNNHPALFAAFCENPTEISFKNQEDDEKILLFLRRHFITNTPWLITSFILIIALPIALFVYSKFPIFNLNLILSHFGIVSAILYYLCVATYMFVNFITWYFNISLITQKRIIDIDFSGLVYKNVSETKLSLVQDASYTQVGVIRSLFDYADVLVQTAGTLDNFDFTAVPHPDKVIQVIEELIGKRGSNVF